MTDRVQPGALGSRTYPMEVGDAVGQFSPGWIVPASDPTLSAERWAGIDETAFTEFDATYGGGSLDVDIGPGEAFVSGWLARDISTTITLAASTAGQTIVLGWNPDATYDDQVHATRDEADEVFISLESDAQDDDPYVPIWEFDTDGSGVTDVTDLRDLGPTHRPDRLETKSARITQGRGFLGLPVHHVEYEDGLADEEIARFSLEADSVLEVWSLEVKLKGGGTNVDFSVDIYDVTNASVIASTTDKAVGGADPVGESGPGATIIVRVSNATGGPVEACLSAKTAVVEDA